MADRMAAEIWIGGKLPRKHVAELTGLCRELELAWGEGPCEIGTEAELLTSREHGVLYFCDDQASNGEFDALETFCVEHKLPFRRHGEGKYEYDPESREYRPDQPGEPECLEITDHSSNPVVHKEKLQKILDKIAATWSIGAAELDIVRLDRERDTLRDVYATLQALVGPVFPDLPPFEVVAATARTMWVWVRMGDMADYTPFDDLPEAIEYLQQHRVGRVLQWVDGGPGAGVETLWYDGKNLISLFWGDGRANLVRLLSEEERDQVRKGLA